MCYDVRREMFAANDARRDVLMKWWVGGWVGFFFFEMCTSSRLSGWRWRAVCSERVHALQNMNFIRLSAPPGMVWYYDDINDFSAESNTHTHTKKRNALTFQKKHARASSTKGY